MWVDTSLKETHRAAVYYDKNSLPETIPSKYGTPSRCYLRVCRLLVTLQPPPPRALHCIGRHKMVEGGGEEVWRGRERVWRGGREGRDDMGEGGKGRKCGILVMVLIKVLVMVVVIVGW